MRLSICLLALLLGCNVTAEILHEIVEEKTSATLRCPHSVGGNVIWSRESHGNKNDILTVNGDGHLKHIHDPGKRYSSLADKSLVIQRVTISDSGRYLCNNEPAVELTVIPSGTIRLNATEGTTITLTCPHDVGGSVPTWSRGSGDIQQEKGFYVSPLDNRLTITSVQLGDSGLYYCDGKPAVYLTVIKGTKTPTTLTTRPMPKTRQTSAATPSKAAAPPPATTTVQSTLPENLRTTTSADTTTAKKKKKKKSTKTPTTLTTRPMPKTRQTSAATSSKTPAPPPATTTVQSAPPLRTTNSTAASKDHQPVLRLVCGVVFSFLVLVIIIIFIIYFTQRRRLKRRGNEERFPVYDEIQDGFVLQPTNGGGSLAESTATYCLAGFSAGSNQNDPTYSTIPDLPPVQKKTNTSLCMESPYSLIGNTFTDEKNKGSSQLSDNTYFLLEKPKVPGNNKDQYL